MRTVSAVVRVAILLLTALLVRAHASPPPMDVGPSNFDTLPYTFVFTSAERDGLIQLGVTVSPKKGSLSPGLLARVHLIKETTEVATIPLEETREGSKVTYWFRIAPAFVAKSRFDFHILSGKEERMPNGATRFIAIPGTLQYQFYIRDYVPSKTVAKRIGASVEHRGGKTDVPAGKSAAGT